ncbi:hypothetical protein Htur_0333 [Haloterrigena turkmenica DSM 5511]|uniref:Uncharacterized protein n=1 Tax=Haloterrigena turkmenica (strain ATCC 51198 / DSM 5511 / JCM 9101 / NCIMB 13204 / VKM B-1734 / 4k) TaxID=543526 RepID=D2RUU1_HALTV|nr:hypothetical protein [Haloterrigena turkmenica]ADB59234.1 hypothetical protein Htur_0333 [Haloterrigena turkmenica DSM 5511]
MHDSRGELEVETLLKIVLALFAIFLAFQILEMVIGGIASLLGPFFVLVQLGVALVIVLWLLERI